MLLFTPGPIPVREDTRVAISGKTMHHRSSEFIDIFKHFRFLFSSLIDMKEFVLFTASGTGAMESAVVNFAKEKSLLISNGEFGERFERILKAFNYDFVLLDYEYGKKASSSDVISILKKNSDIKSVFLQQCESSTGILNDVEQIAKEIKYINKDILVIVDSISHIGTSYINTANIDVLLGCSQKAFALPAGLATISMSALALDSLNENRGYYFDILKELKNQKNNVVSHTVPTSLVIGFVKILEEINEFGVNNFYNHIKKTSSASKAAIKAIGLELFPVNHDGSDSMSTIKHKRSNDIKALLQSDYYMQVAGGHGSLNGKIIRINHMGFIKPYESLWAVNALELALDKLDIRKFDGKAALEFNKSFYKES